MLPEAGLWLVCQVEAQPWHASPFSSCDSSACTLCHKPALHEACQARQVGPGLLQGFLGKVGRAISKHGRPQHPKILDDTLSTSRTSQPSLPRSTQQAELGAVQVPGLSNESQHSNPGRKRSALSSASEGDVGVQAVPQEASHKSQSQLERPMDAASKVRRPLAGHGRGLGLGMVATSSIWE